MESIEERIQVKLKEALPFMTGDKKHELLGLVEAIPDARRAFEEAFKQTAPAPQPDERKAEETA